jgi:dihydrofolate reductase
MGQVVAIEHLTLDGVYQAPAREDEDRRDGFDLGGWAMAASAPEMPHVIGARMGSSWSLLAGRVTYEDLAGFWPKQPANPITDALTNAEKFVISNTLAEPLAWQNSTLLRGDGAEAVERLKKRHDKRLVIFGSGALVQSLVQRKLVDEFVLQVHPVVLGKGRRLFAEGSPFTKLKLIESVPVSTGVVILTYQ